MYSPAAQKPEIKTSERRVVLAFVVIAVTPSKTHCALTAYSFEPPGFISCRPRWSAYRCGYSGDRTRPDGLLLQGARRLPVVQRPVHGGDRRPPGRSRLPTPASAAMGAVGAQAPALVPGAGAYGGHCLRHLFLRVVEAHLRERSPGASPRARLGAVSFVHRFGASLNRHLHCH